MTIFASESELDAVLDKIDRLVRECIDGSLDGVALDNQLWALYGGYALDGHESDPEEKAMLARHGRRIAWVSRVLDELGQVCRDEDAAKEAFIRAGRFGSAEARRRLRLLVANRDQTLT